MFLLVQRTDTLPEMRALVNTAHIVAALPVGSGARTKLYLAVGESWEVSLPFNRAVSLLREEAEAGV